jgi:hypothetical protein
MADYPDPAVTASIYCNRQLDRLLHAVIAPFWREVRSRHPDVWIWFFRYGRGGEHLKLRIHGPAAVGDIVRALLERHLEPFFANPVSDPPDGVWISKSALPPLDLEDETEDDYPNKSLLWTHYRRRPEPFGCELYTRDDTHLELFVRTQAAAAEVLLERLAPEVDGPRFAQVRQNLFIKLLVLGLAATDFDAAQWAAYHAYHREWLIQTLVRIPGTISRQAILEELETRLGAGRAGALALASRIEAGVAAERPPASPDAFGSWSRAMTDFFGHVRAYRGRPEYDQDPFTRDFAYLPLHKVFNGVANQFGYRLSHEAYVHHLLCVAAEAAAAAVGESEAC